MFQPVATVTLSFAVSQLTLTCVEIVILVLIVIGTGKKENSIVLKAKERCHGARFMLLVL